MICRKCGTILPDNSIRCTNCGIKVNIVCPQCKTLTPFGEKHCINCGFEFIKICPSCHSSNIYSATECRKCKTPFSQTEKTVITEKETAVQNEIKSILTENNEIAIEVVEPISTEELSSAEPSVIFEENDNCTAEPQIIQQEQEKYEVEETEREEYDEISSVEERTEEEKNVNINQNDEEIHILNSEEEEFTEKEEYEYTDIEENGIEELTTETENTENTQSEPEVKSDIEQEIQQDENEEDDEIYTNSVSNENIPSNENNETDLPEQEEEEEEESLQYIIQQNAVIEIIQNIKKSITKHIIAINGPEGCGKTAAINQIRNILSNDGYLCLYGSCTPLSQITSFGYFQDALLRMIGLPPYINSSEAFIRDFKKSNLNNIFNFLHQHELSLFINLLYPAQKDSFENILENKQLMFSILEKVIKTFLTNSNIVMIIDNFDLLDGASYDFITYMAGKNFFNNRLKLLVAYQDTKPVQNYFDLTVKDDSIFSTINLEKLTPQELIDTINSSTGINLADIIPSDYLDEIIKRADGNAINLEQYMAYLFDTNYLMINNEEIEVNESNKPENEPETLDELMKFRLSILPAEVKNVLFMASIMGFRFATNILCHAVPMHGKKALNILDVLREELLISPVDEFTCEFKNLTIWKYIYKEAKADPFFKDNSERLYSILKSRVLSSNIQKIISCSQALSKEEEFIIWQDTSYITAKLGDTNLYVIAQKQCLKILEEQNLPNADTVREIIYEQMGKLLSRKSPGEAIGYLANVLDAKIKTSDTNKIIDLSGYFVNSCYLTGNYFGVKEAVDAIITNINSTGSKISDTDLALIKTRKLNALLNIGNTEEVINIIKEEILPDLNKELTIKQTDTSYKNLLTDAWFLSNIALAKAYLIQGKQSVFSITASMRDYIENNKIKSEYYNAQIDIIEAFAHSTRGEVSLSNDILTSILEHFNDKSPDKKLLCELNLVSIINRIFSNQIHDLKEDLFELAAFSNNINEHFIKNIAKLILGYVIKQEGNTVKALTIYNDEITYFAKEKIAIGALLSWALITEASIDNGDIDMALNTATKALEIAEGPKINNLFFIIYFQKFIAQIYEIKGDFAAVKMYLEKALAVAKQNNLKYQLAHLYIDYGNYIECLMKTQKTYSDDYIKLTLDMYNKALSIANELKIDYLTEKASRERTNFKRYCQLNSIEI